MQKFKQFILTKSVGFYINILSLWNPQKATLLAYQLFSNPREGRLSKDKLPGILQTAIAETITVDDDYFQTYKWPGDATVILLAHGWESNASRWERLLPHLQKSGHTIIAIDAPAHGLSSGTEFNVPQYANFIDAVARRYQPKYIVGHSIGGIASVYYQHHFHHAIEKLVLLGSPSDFRILIDNYVNMLSLKSNIHDYLVHHTGEKFNINIDDFSGRIFLKDATVRGLIAHDLLDDVVAISEARKLAESWKHAEFIETSGLGHSMHDDNLYQKIANFLKD